MNDWVLIQPRAPPDRESSRVRVGLPTAVGNRNCLRAGADGLGASGWQGRAGAVAALRAANRGAGAGLLRAVERYRLARAARRAGIEVDRTAEARQGRQPEKENQAEEAAHSESHETQHSGGRNYKPPMRHSVIISDLASTRILAASAPSCPSRVPILRAVSAAQAHASPGGRTTCSPSAIPCVRRAPHRARPPARLRAGSRQAPGVPEPSVPHASTPRPPLGAPLHLPGPGAVTRFSRTC